MRDRPEDLQFLSGILLVSREPSRLSRFYRDVLGVPLEEERHGDSQPHWGCELGDVHFAIHSVEDYPENARLGVGAVKLAFQVFDLAELVEWLHVCDVELCYEPTPLGSESLVTAVHDPDGNLVELTQLGPAWLEHLQARRADGHDLVQRWTERQRVSGPGGD
jgi:catechol 2,3-dioxygenase-like lactoylglutathione lyase family enzyme